MLNPNYKIINRPNGTWFIHFTRNERMFHTHLGNVIDYMNNFSKFLDENLGLGLHECYRDGLNWKEAAEVVCVKLQEDCARQILEIFVEAQECVEKYLEKWYANNSGTKRMFEATNRRTYGYESTMSSDEKKEQMVLNKFVSEMFAFEEL